MPTVKRIVCLANSRKLNGRCIAGIEIADGQRLGWIRPVSARQHQEVSQDEQQYVDGTEPHVLDIRTVPLLDPVPRDHQQENWLLEDKAGPERRPCLLAIWSDSSIQLSHSGSTGITLEEELTTGSPGTSHGTEKLPSSLSHRTCPASSSPLVVDLAHRGVRCEDGSAIKAGTTAFRSPTLRQRRYLAEPDGYHEIRRALSR